MEAVMKEFNEDQPSNANAWLWGDEVLSDVKLAFQNLAVGTTASAGAQGFHLHATVLCSSSLYFRTRITSAVGTSGSKRKRCEHLVEVVDAGQRRAAASLLRFFYTSQLLSIEDSCCSAKRLLQMMKVRCYEHRQGPQARFGRTACDRHMASRLDNLDRSLASNGCLKAKDCQVNWTCFVHQCQGCVGMQ